ncbi:MAG: DNA translocase FtsK 4TM domain-containing protein [Rikenellaceae bacterium]
MSVSRTKQDTTTPKRRATGASKTASKPATRTAKAQPRRVETKPPKPRNDSVTYTIAILTFSAAVLLMGAIISYFFTWKDDQALNELANAVTIVDGSAQNSIGSIGAWISNLLVDRLFGVMALAIPLIILSFSMVLLRLKGMFFRKAMLSLLTLMFIGSIFAAYITPTGVEAFGSSYGGEWGYRVNRWSLNLLGDLGTAIILFTLIAIWLVYTSLNIVKYLGKTIVIFFAAIGRIFGALFMGLERLLTYIASPKKKKPVRIPKQEERINKEEITPIAVVESNDVAADSDESKLGDKKPEDAIESFMNSSDTLTFAMEERKEREEEETFNMSIEERTEDKDENKDVDEVKIEDDFIQAMNYDNFVIFKPLENQEDEITNQSDEESIDDIDMIMTEKEQQPIEQQPIEQLTPTIETQEQEVAEQPSSTTSLDDSFEISGGYTQAEEIKEGEFEVAITSNAELDIDKSKLDENIVITTNTPSEVDEIDNSVFDPTLELSSYKLPDVEMLDNHSSKVVVTEEELVANKNRIVETLNNFNISIDKIKATIGPTVTLYEIKPAAGVRISKIKNLEDDIALSLSALGIRIIAPIPGKGTIGIEVPNKNKEIVSMYSVIKSAKFQESKYELPVVLGRTIQNDDFVIDLAKMPHLLVAGATGQGKSVGLNAIITSLLYKKHPAELKFIMVDPKRVELTLYQNIENHFLAKMEDEPETIITDTQRVVYTLNSLCIEMEDRYKLLNKAKARNIIEYNEKFKKRKVNPNNGHRFLPYFVVIIDEFADLIMTAGKEVEIPIARIAQLARAVGIHLVIATQRPTTNIITGVIKANFPARIAFRVSSMVDSRTILDQPGANQLIGRGDMLVSTGSDITRVQCAFIDTPEVERITDYIGEQRGFGSPYILPDYTPEGDSKLSGGSTQTISKMDDKFTEVARYVVQNQQGSASTIQRNFSIGFNRAGRLMDQLERAGIVGRQEGSKPRQVLISDMASLEILLYDLEENNSTL